MTKLKIESHSYRFRDTYMQWSQYYWLLGAGINSAVFPPSLSVSRWRTSRSTEWLV